MNDRDSADGAARDVERSHDAPDDSPGTGRTAPDGHDAGEAEDARGTRLKPEDQARVDAFLRRGVNAVERKPFRPLLLMLVLVVVVTALSLLSQWLAGRAGIY